MAENRSDRPAVDHVRQVPTSDRSLLRRLQRGQRDAATELYLRYANRLHALARSQRGDDLASRVDPEDLVQSIFRTFFRRAVEGHYDVPEGEELWKLLLVITLHKIRDEGAFHRAAKRDVRATRSGAAFDLALTSISTDDDTELAELRMVIEEILQPLPASQRLIVELRIEGYQVEEIAARTNRSKRSVERGLQEFRSKLALILQEDE